MPFKVVSEVGRGTAVLWESKSLKRRGSYVGKRGAFHCNQWGLCDIVILCCEG